MRITFVETEFDAVNFLVKFKKVSWADFIGFVQHKFVFYSVTDRIFFLMTEKN